MKNVTQLVVGSLFLLLIVEMVVAPPPEKPTSTQGCTPESMLKKYGNEKKTIEDYRRVTEDQMNAETAAVRCCKKTMEKLQNRPRGAPGHDPTLISWSCATPENCPVGKSYDEAALICKNMTMEICTNREITTGICCGSGCNFDSKAVWIKGSK